MKMKMRIRMMIMTSPIDEDEDGKAGETKHLVISQVEGLTKVSVRHQ